MPKVSISMQSSNNPPYLELLLPIGNKSKFRCKIPNNAFGQPIRACDKSVMIPNNAYIEWQIGYSISDISLSMHQIIVLTNEYSYELSDILHELKLIGLLSQAELTNMIVFVSNISNFLQGNISLQSNPMLLNLNGVSFSQQNAVLPNYYVNLNNVDINVLFSKQQFACSTQPMVYLNIPLSSLQNSQQFINRPGKGKQYGIFRIDNTNINLVKELVYIFASLSPDYKNDILLILNAI